MHVGVHKMGIMKCTSVIMRKACSSVDSVVLFVYSCHQTVPISAASPNCLGSMSNVPQILWCFPSLPWIPSCLHKEWRSSITGCLEGDGQTRFAPNTHAHTTRMIRTYWAESISMFRMCQWGCYRELECSGELCTIRILRVTMGMP